MRTRSLILLLLATLSGCSESDPTRSVAPDQLITLTASLTAIPADGVSRTRLTAQIPPDASAGNRTVTFKSTGGTLLGGTNNSLAVPVDVEGRAVADLLSPTRPGSAEVSAQVSNFVRTMAVAFTGALPDRITVDAGTFSLLPGLANSTTVTATLRRGSGVASENTTVTFRALTSGGSRLGEFRSVTLSNSSGQATALYTAGETTFRGTVKIFARVEDVTSGTVVEGQATLQIVEPPAS